MRQGMSAQTDLVGGEAGLEVLRQGVDGVRQGRVRELRCRGGADAVDHVDGEFPEVR